MKKGIKVLSLGLLLLSGCGFAIAGSKVSQIKEADAIGNYSTNASTYYNSITATSGQQLAAQLHDLITSTHQYYTSYDDNGKNKYQQNTDQYYENGSKVNGYIYEFYSGVKWPNAWAPNAGDTTGGYNREHCWCQSNSVNTAGKQMWGTDGGGADMHHLRPVEVRLNSTRNNHPYGEVGSNRDQNKVYAKLGSNATYALGGYYYNDVFEPLDSVKGDVARIILYTYLHYNSYSVSSVFGSYGTTNGSGSSDYFSTTLLSLTKTTNQNTEAKALEMLLSWNASDPVDEIEQRRNEQVAKYQGNRNPFIDNSNYAEMIWGTGSVTPTVNSVTVSPSTLSLDLNGTTTGNLTATVSVSNGAAQTVNWTSSNTNVATVSSSGVVTAKAKGTCTITATSTVNSNKSGSCSVTVADTSSGGSSSSGTITINYSDNFSPALPTASGSVNSTSTAHTDSTASNFEFKEQGIYKDSNADYIMFASGKGYIFNTTSLGTINSVSVTYSSGTSTSGKTGVYFGSAQQSTYTTSNNETVKGQSQTDTWSNSTSGYGYFQLSTSNKNVQITQIVISYSSGSASPAPTLSSISLSTSNTQTDFEVGDEFDYTGLVVTAHYSDGTENIVEPTSVSEPVMSTAGEKTITVSYTEGGVTKTAEYTITLTEAVTSEHGRQPDDPLTVSEAVAICEETGTTQTEEHYYTQGIVSAITEEFNSQFGNICFTISADGETTGTQLTVYRCKYLNGAKFTSADQLTVGMEVIIVGYLVNYKSNTPEYVSNSYVYQYIDNSGSGSSGSTSLTQTFSQNGYSNAAAISSVTFYEKNSQTITGTFDKGSNNNAPKYYTDGSAIRAYGGNTITITSSKANLKSITIEFGSSDGSNAITADCGTYSNGTWEGTASSVIFTIGGTSGNRRVASISVTYYNADNFASDFVSGITCNVNGTSAPTGNWTTITNKYNTLFTEDQNTLKNATYTTSGSGSQTVVTPGDGTSQAVANAVSKYDKIISRYGTTSYPNFMNRSIPGANSPIAIVNKQDTSIIVVVLSMSCLSLFAVSIFIIKKKKQY